LAGSGSSSRGGSSGRARFLNITGAVLIAGGLILLGYYGYLKAVVLYNQYQLKQAYRESFLEIPDAAEPFRRVILSEWLPTRLQIPKIGVDLMVIGGAGTDVFDETLLDKAPVHFQMSDLPGTEPGNVAIAGHRGSRWGFFTDLDRLEAGDLLYLDTAGYRFTYVVEWVRIVDPYEWSVIESTDYPALTLQTCEPKTGPSTHRLIVRGALEEVVPAPQE
jgi:LPXTG-site transpeptidase (sortase) family protein